MVYPRTEKRGSWIVIFTVFFSPSPSNHSLSASGSGTFDTSPKGCYFFLMIIVFELQ